MGMRKITLFLAFALVAGAGVAQAGMVYGVRSMTAYNNAFVSFDPTNVSFLDPTASNAPKIINSAFTPASVRALDFDPTGTTLYAIDDSTSGDLSLGTIDTATGVFTKKVSVTNWPGDTGYWLNNRLFMSLKIDPTTGTFYVIGANGWYSTLYSLDPVTGTVTVIGEQTTAAYINDLAISATGQMYATDMIDNALYSLDKTTGAVTLINTVTESGAEANFGYMQHMDFDYDSGVLYTAQYLADDYNKGTWGTLDPTTGVLTLLEKSLRPEELFIALDSPAPAVPTPDAVLLGASGLLVSLTGLRRKYAR